MIAKSPILPERVRKIPRSFSWVDHRLISHNHIDQCSHAAAALYLFLLCAADDKGISYYGDKSIMKKLSMDQKTLQQARSDLTRFGLLAWQKPLYQVLDLEPVQQRMGSVMRLGDILNKAMEETS